MIGYLFLNIVLYVATILADNSPGFSFLEAQSLMNSKKWAEAAIVLRSSIEEKPNFLPARIQLATALMRLKRGSEALGILTRQALVETGKRKDMLVSKIHVFSRIFFSQDILKLYLEGLQLMEGAKIKDAKTKLLQAIEVEGDNVEILLRLGQCLALDGDYDSASERLRTAKQLNPFEPQIKLWLGRALTKRGELFSAQEELKAAYTELPHLELATLWYADVLSALDQKQLAAEILEKEIQQHPNHLLSAITLARLKYENPISSINMLETTIKDLKTVFQRLKDPYKTYRNQVDSELGFSFFKEEDVTRETQVLMQAIENKIDKLKL